MDRADSLLGAERSALELAELCERKAALLRQLAETCAAERSPIADGWQWAARDVASTLETKAARGSKTPATYATQCGLLAVSFTLGRSAWTLDGKAIARHSALAMIGERMESRLG